MIFSNYIGTLHLIHKTFVHQREQMKIERKKTLDKGSKEFLSWKNKARKQIIYLIAY